MSTNEPGKKPKKYYVDYKKRYANNEPFRRRGQPNEANNARFKQTPEFGSGGGNRGFLITAIDEVKSYLEMKHVMEQYFHEIYDSQPKNELSKVNKEMSTEEELESELKHLRLTRPFKQIKTHCRNTIFLNIVDTFSHVDPVALVDIFFEDMEEKQSGRTSNTCRVLPVLDTFQLSTEEAKKSITRILTSNYPEEEAKYFIEFASRGNYKLESDDKQRMIEGVAEAVHITRPKWQVNRTESDYIIALTALKNVCCLSIMKNYFKRSKYNVVEFCKKFSLEESDSSKQEQAAGDMQDDDKQLE